MKKFFLSVLVLGAVGLTSCGNDDDNNSGDGGGDADSTCQTCPEYTVAGITVPAQEVCEGENGNAFVSGIDTTIPFDTYITTWETAGSVDCQ